MAKNSSISIDGRDKVLLRALQRRGRTTNSELAGLAAMSESACLRRVRQLEAAGVIDRYVAVLSPEEAGYPINVLVTVTLASQSEAALAAFETAVAKVPEIMECYLMTGTSDYVLRVVASGISDLERLHSTRITRLAGVMRISSSLIMRTVVKRDELPL